MKKTFVQITLGALFLMLACVASGHATPVNDCTVLSVTLASATVTAGNGIFDYDLTAPAPCFLTFGDDLNIEFTNLGGTITGVGITGTLLGDSPAESHGATTATFFIPGEFDLLSATGTMEIDCSSCAEGPVDVSIGVADPSIMGPVAATVTGAPEPGSFALLLSGLAGLALLAGVARRKRHAAEAA